MFFCFLFFFKQKTAYEMRISDWSSDLCSSDLADTENRQANIEHRLRRPRRTVQRGRFRPTREHDAPGTECGNLGWIVIPGPDFAIHTDFANTPRNQLRVLRAEVEDEDLVAVTVGHRAAL